MPMIKLKYQILNALSNSLWLAEEIVMWLNNATYSLAEYLSNIELKVEEKRNELYWKFHDKSEIEKLAIEIEGEKHV
jgi:hypothetical protein